MRSLLFGLAVLAGATTASASPMHSHGVALVDQLPTWQAAVAPKGARTRSVLQIVRQDQDLVGLRLSQRPEGVTVVETMAGSPAHMAGIRSGSVILQVDGADVRGEDLVRVVSRIRAAPGPVWIGVLHGDSVEGVELAKQSAWSCYRSWSDDAEPGVVATPAGTRVRIRCPPWAVSWVADTLGR